MTNTMVREKTDKEELGCIIRRRRLTWQGQVARMSDDRRAKHVMNRVPEEKGRSRKNWLETIREDLKKLNLMRKDALDAAEDRYGWRKCIARCAVLHGKE